MSLLIEHKWQDLPAYPSPAPLPVRIRLLTDILDVGASVPFYSLLESAVLNGPVVTNNTEELKWIRSLLDNFDTYMTRVIQATHFELWDKDYNIRREYRNEYPGGPVSESNNLPLMTIVARLLKYNELMREIVYLREGPVNRGGTCNLDLDFYIVPPITDTVPIWHSLSTYDDPCRPSRLDV